MTCTSFFLKHNIPLLLVELVEKRNDKFIKIGENQIQRTVNNHIKEACDELGIPFLSIPQLRPIGSYDWVAWHHYSVESNQLIGTDIAKWVNIIMDDDLKLIVTPH